MGHGASFVRRWGAGGARLEPDTRCEPEVCWWRPWWRQREQQAQCLRGVRAGGGSGPLPLRVRVGIHLLALQTWDQHAVALEGKHAENRAPRP